MAPLKGAGVLEIAPQLGMSVVERMLGGKGEPEETPEALSEIEINLLDDILMVILEEWCRLWGGEEEMNASIVGRESGGRYLQTSASETVMLVVAFEGSFGECTERVQLAFPFPSVEGILRRMAASKIVEDKVERPKARAEWRSTFNSIPIPLSVEWDACQLSLRDVVGLESGSVVQLSNELLKATYVRLADVTKFVGEIGIENGRLAIRIDQKVSTEEV
jgi:flagellar motor switch protein FliM